MAIRYTFKAYERLKREQHIHTLFLTGKAYSVFPVRFIYSVVPRNGEPAPVRIGFSVPKKKFPRSVHRHRVRRLMVEAWRLHKHLLYSAIPEHLHLHLFLIFTDITLPEYELVQTKIITGIERLAQHLAALPDNA